MSNKYVYLVYEQDYNDVNVFGVYTDKRDAEKWISPDGDPKT